MSETLTPQNEEKDLFAEAFEDHFAIDQRKAAFRIIHDDAETSAVPKATSTEARTAVPRPTHRVRNGLIATGTGFGVVAASAGLGVAISETPAFKEPSFSSATTPHMVKNDETLDSIIESVPGYNTAPLGDIESHIKTDPANIPIFKDGLQAGETIQVPVSINGAKPSNTYFK